MTAAAVPSPAAPVVLIDLSAIYHACWRVNSAEQPISVAFQATLDGVRRCANYRQDALVAVCLDSRTNWRKKLSPDYKAQREKMEAAFYDCFDRVKARLRADGYLLWEAENFEADDVIAAAVDGAVTAGHEVVICSADKDLAQLLKHQGVTMLRTSTWEPMDATAAQAKYLVPPTQMGDMLALVGDSSDNVAGIPGVGPKTAAALLAAHGSIEGIYDAMAKGTIELKGAKLEALQQNIPQLELARKLVALRYDAPIDFAQIYQERKQEPLTKDDTNMNETEDAEFSDPAISPPRTNGTATAAANEVKADKPSDAAKPAEHMTTQPPQSTALVSVPVSYELALEPTHLGQAQKLAAVLHDSRMYPKLANDAQIFAVIVRGRELGLGALVSLDVFSIVEGRLSPSAHFIIAKAKAHPDCKYLTCVDTTPTSATWETWNKNNPKPTRLTYTIEQAKLAGRVDKEKGQWTRMPAEMCRKIAGVQLARMEYPDAALGLYADVEVE